MSTPRPISNAEKQKRQNAFDAYEVFVKEEGHATPASSSVMAAFISDNWKDMKASPGYLAKIMGEKYGVNEDDVNREIKRQKTEKFAAMRAQRSSMRESRIKITKRQLKKIIQEAMPDAGVPDVIGAMGGGKFQPRSDKATAMGQTRRGDELFDARDNLLGLIEMLEPNELGP